MSRHIVEPLEETRSARHQMQQVIAITDLRGLCQSKVLVLQQTGDQSMQPLRIWDHIRVKGRHERGGATREAFDVFVPVIEVADFKMVVQGFLGCRVVDISS